MKRIQHRRQCFFRILCKDLTNYYVEVIPKCFCFFRSLAFAEVGDVNNGPWLLHTKSHRLLLLLFFFFWCLTLTSFQMGWMSYFLSSSIRQTAYMFNKSQQFDVRFNMLRHGSVTERERKAWKRKEIDRTNEKRKLSISSEARETALLPAPLPPFESDSHEGFLWFVAKAFHSLRLLPISWINPFSDSS